MNTSQYTCHTHTNGKFHFHSPKTLRTRPGQPICRQVSSPVWDRRDSVPQKNLSDVFHSWRLFEAWNWMFLEGVCCSVWSRINILGQRLSTNPAWKPRNTKKPEDCQVCSGRSGSFMKAVHNDFWRVQTETVGGGSAAFWVKLNHPLCQFVKVRKQMI